MDVEKRGADGKDWPCPRGGRVHISSRTSRITHSDLYFVYPDDPYLYFKRTLIHAKAIHSPQKDQ